MKTETNAPLLPVSTRHKGSAKSLRGIHAVPRSAKAAARNSSFLQALERSIAAVQADIRGEIELPNISHLINELRSCSHA
jgi:hypothetical protein